MQTLEERIERAREVSSQRLLTQADFKRLRARQLQKRTQLTLRRNPKTVQTTHTAQSAPQAQPTGQKRAFAATATEGDVADAKDATRPSASKRARLDDDAHTDQSTQEGSQTTASLAIVAKQSYSFYIC